MSFHSLVQIQLRTLRSCWAAVALELSCKLCQGISQADRVVGGPGGLHGAITAHYGPRGPGTQSHTLLGSMGALHSYCFF